MNKLTRKIMKMKKRKIIVLILFSFLNIGCQKQQINYEKALSSEYLSKSVKEYKGCDQELKKLSTEKKTKLFYSAYEQDNLPLSTFYLSIGAEIQNNKEGKNVMISTTKRAISSERYYQFLLSVIEHDQNSLSFPVVQKHLGLGNDTLSNIIKKETIVLGYLFYNYDIERLKEICGKIKDLNSILDSQGKNVLMIIAEEREGTGPNSGLIDGISEKKKKMELLVSSGIDLSYLSSIEHSNLLNVLTWGINDDDYSDIINSALEKGVDINNQDIYGRTPLYNAVYPKVLSKNNVKFIKFLLIHGADKEIADKENLIPYDITFKRELFFKNWGSDTRTKNKDNSILDSIRKLVTSSESIQNQANSPEGKYILKNGKLIIPEGNEFVLKDDFHSIISTLGSRFFIDYAPQNIINYYYPEKGILLWKYDDPENNEIHQISFYFYPLNKDEQIEPSLSEVIVNKWTFSREMNIENIEYLLKSKGITYQKENNDIDFVGENGLRYYLSFDKSNDFKLLSVTIPIP